ncbi:MAG TPA: hypothetical protein VFB55_11180, partial [Verrucomicrobiae bacterium]|nr:hypothetical protein [Verrucomicrobiae bacterium]
DALLDGPKDWFLTQNTYQNGKSGGLYNSRSIGVNLIGAARFATFLAATGDPDAPAVLKEAENDYVAQVKPELCVSGYPAGCTLGKVDGGPWNTQGVSRTRGVPWGSAGTSGSWCGVSHAYRVNSSFQSSILIQGLLELRNAEGPFWPEYYNALDLAYGIARWNLSENYVDDGSGRWDINGFRFGLALDVPNSCKNPGETPEPDFQPTPTQTTAMTFLAKYLVDGTTEWATKFKINMQKDMASLGVTTSDFGEYQLATIIDILNNPGPARLNDVPITRVADNGGGSYTIYWVAPAGAQSYRIKWGAKPIVDWIGFDPTNNVFLGDPAKTMPWFAATNVPNLPAPAAPGTVQSLTIQTGVPGLTTANFSVKAYVVGSGGAAPAPSNLVLVSGNGQTAAAGSSLSSPLVVKVVDASGAPVPGVVVTFAVTAGGGSLSTTQTISDAAGLASATFQLGPQAGTNTVKVSSGSLSPVIFTATGTAPATAARLVLVSGNNQSGTVSKPLSNPFLVMVVDASGRPVSGVTVTFTVTSGGGSL